MEEQQQINTNKSELWNLTLKDLFYKYVRFLPLFLLSVAIALFLAFAYLRYTTRIFSATGSMMIKYEQQTGTSDKIENIIEGNNSRTQNLQNEIEVLRSRPLMERVVRKLDLQFSYTARGKIKDYNIYNQGPFVFKSYKIADSLSSFSMGVKFINDHQFRIDNDGPFSFGELFQNSHGVFSLVKRGPAAAGNEFTVTWQRAANVAGAFAAGVKVQPKTPGTSILSITLQSTNSQMAADIINTLMVEYDSMTVEQNNYSNDQMIDFINERIRAMGNEIDSLQLIFLKYRQANKLYDVEQQMTNYLSRLSDIDKSMVEQEFQLAQAQDIDAYLRNRQNDYNPLTPSPLTLEDRTLNELVVAYNRAQLERQGLLDGNVPANNPFVKELDGQIAKIREKLLESVKNIKLSYSSAINTMKMNVGSEQAKLEGLPYKLKVYLEMQRQINTKQVLYGLLENKREEAAIRKAAVVSNSTVVDRAGASNVPVKPNKKTIQILAILAGLGIPALLIFIGEVLNDKINTRFDIEKLTQAPILGEIGHSFADNTLIVNRTSRTMVSEQFRIIRSNLQYVVNKPDKTIILVTSSFSGEGKSFVSTNMAAVMALAGKKTIILEFDIRKPKVLSGLHMSKRAGITNYLMGKAELEELIAPVPDQENLFVLSCGPIPPNPAEMLLDNKVADLFERIGKMFDVIYIDTAPVGMVSDALTLGKFADCTLYLVRQGHTFKKQITLIDELYRDNKLPKVSIVINDVKNKPGYGYYGYGRYGYGYGYGYGSSYYEEEKQPLSWFERTAKKYGPTKWIRRFFR